MEFRNVRYCRESFKKIGDYRKFNFLVAQKTCVRANKDIEFQVKQKVFLIFARE